MKIVILHLNWTTDKIYPFSIFTLPEIRYPLRSRTKMSEKFLNILDFFVLEVPKCQKKWPSTKMSENEYQNLRNSYDVYIPKNLRKFQNFLNLKYSSESACPI